MEYTKRSTYWSIYLENILTEHDLTLYESFLWVDDFVLESLPKMEGLFHGAALLGGAIIWPIRCRTVGNNVCPPGLRNPLH